MDATLKSNTTLTGARGALDRETRKRIALNLSLFTGLVLSIIGVRFFAVPEQAAFTFGLGGVQDGHSLHHVIAARDLWLGGLAIAFALLREWRSLALWFGLAALVCFTDATIVSSAGGPLAAILFHTMSGVFCAILTQRCWLYSKG